MFRHTGNSDFTPDSIGAYPPMAGLVVEEISGTEFQSGSSSIPEHSAWLDDSISLAGDLRHVVSDAWFYAIPADITGAV